jgi:hypothetical protein
MGFVAFSDLVVGTREGMKCVIKCRFSTEKCLPQSKTDDVIRKN